MGSTRITAEHGIPQIVAVREFDAPRELVFRAFTDPRLLERWMGPRTLTLTVDELDARDGGRWRHTSRDADGNTYSFHGLYHGTPSPDGIVQTLEYEDEPGHVSLNTITFEPRGARTTLLRQNTVFQSVEDRDAYVAGGMEAGLNESMDRLADLLTTQRPTE